MHAYFAQGVSAFFVGLVLAYVALEYSIYWSIPLHVLKNLALSELWDHMVSIFPDAVQEVLEWGMMSLFLLDGCPVPWKNRWSVTAT